VLLGIELICEGATLGRMAWDARQKLVLPDVLYVYAWHADALRPHQFEMAVGDRYRMNIEIRLGLVARFHDGRRRGHNRNVAASTYPIDVAMPVHHNCAVSETSQTANKPISVDESGTNTLGRSPAFSPGREPANAPVEI
jgi:hypothetical protein